MGFSLLVLFWFYLVVETFTSVNCCFLDDRSCYDFGSAISPSIAPGSCYYQAGVWVGLEGITRVMPLYESLAWGAWVGLKGLATIIHLPTPSALVFILLYVANILAIAQDIED